MHCTLTIYKSALTSQCICTTIILLLLFIRLQESNGFKINADDGLSHKQVDLDKIFKPATDSGEVTPSKNSTYTYYYLS